MEFKRISHKTNIRVRYADTDKMGFVYNGNYLAFFEVGRTELIRSTGLPYTEFEDAGYQLPLVEAKVEYKNPAHYDDVLEVEAYMDFELKATIQLNYVVRRGETVIAKGYTIHSFMNAETQRAVRPPKIFVEAIQSSM
jgi:acyl-CoA thioester hydrolase